MAIVTELTLYPIKSCAGIPVAAATVTVEGLAAHGVRDREWMLVDGDGLFLSQREHPHMALLAPRLYGEALHVDAPGMAPLALPLGHVPGTAPRQVRIWDDSVEADDCGDEAAAWFSQALGLRCRLVRFRPGVVRPTSTKWTAGVPAATHFADAYPLLLIGAASLADLNARLGAAGRVTLPMNRFRPNLVVDGIEAYEEDYVESLCVGGAVLKPVKPCSRCPIPSVDQATGERGPDPLDILQTYRGKPQLDGAPCFGMNCIVAAGAGSVLAVGQEVQLTLAF
jgi:uncharacterized protein